LTCLRVTLRNVRRVLLTPRWLALHLLAVVLVYTCLRLSWWQFARAEAGNGRSLGYALQWPGFGVFVLGMWFWLARDAVRGGPAARVRPEPELPPGRLPDDVVLPPVREFAAPGVASAEAEEDDELAAYNRLLAALHRQDVNDPHIDGPHENGPRQEDRVEERDHA
jgi:hypothetical protein